MSLKAVIVIPLVASEEKSALRSIDFYHMDLPRHSAGTLWRTSRSQSQGKSFVVLIIDIRH